MKDNKDRNELDFGPRYKDLEEESRRLARARNYDRFDFDASLDLPPLPVGPFPQPGVIIEENDPTFLFTMAPVRGRRTLYFDTTNSFGLGAGAVFGLDDKNYNANQSSFQSRPSNIAYKNVQTEDAATILPTLPGEEPTSMALVEGVMWKSTRTTLSYYQIVSEETAFWTNIAPPFTTGGYKPRFSNIYTDPKTGQSFVAYVMSWLSGTARVASFYLGVFESGSIRWVFLGALGAGSTFGQNAYFLLHDGTPTVGLSVGGNSAFIGFTGTGALVGQMSVVRASLTEGYGAVVAFSNCITASGADNLRQPAVSAIVNGAVADDGTFYTIGRPVSSATWDNVRQYTVIPNSGPQVGVGGTGGLIVASDIEFKTWAPSDVDVKAGYGTSAGDTKPEIIVRNNDDFLVAWQTAGNVPTIYSYKPVTGAVTMPIVGAGSGGAVALTSVYDTPGLYVFLAGGNLWRVYST
jgi:hypothetical protein